MLDVETIVHILDDFTKKLDLQRKNIKEGS